MASSSLYLFPQEGLNYLLNAIPKGSIVPSTLYVGLFTTPWSTVEGYGYTNIAVTLNSGTYPVTEVSGTSGGGYTRQAVTSGNWGAPTAGTTVIGANTINVQQSTYNSALTFTCTSGTWTNVYGIFVATSGQLNSVSNGTSMTVLWYAPFSDQNAVTLASGDSLAITPTWQIAPYPV